ncbi:MAG: hypothetical protein M3Y56_12370 [Armatimonadota bacterium]|nr:hypothetical protein [Armatimonadota bacterium]
MAWDEQVPATSNVAVTIVGIRDLIPHSCRYYNRWDLRVTGFVIDGNAPPMNEAVKRAYARFSPGGVVAQKIPDEGLVDGVPFLRIGSDLVGPPEKGADRIAAAASRHGPAFAIYRAILWSPAGNKQLFERLKQIRRDIDIVEPNTLFLLMKHLLEGK